jgi:hypothetical protein
LGVERTFSQAAHGGRDCGEYRQAAGTVASVKQQGPPGSAPGRPFVADARTTVVVLWVWWTACTFRAAPHAASGERCAAPHVARGERYAGPHVARGDRRAALDAGSYRTLLERTLLLERALPERMAVPEPQHLMSLAWWSARQTRPLVREGKTRLDARSFL